jgi:hypothetical protein
MRIQEHLYQGFFGIKKKQDAAKYYKERVEKINSLDKKIDSVIDSYQKLLSNHNSKREKCLKFVQNPTLNNLKIARIEVEKLEGMFDEDELANNSEQDHVKAMLSEVKQLSKTEESEEMKILESDLTSELEDLLRVLKSLEPVWQNQIDFIKRSDDAIMIEKTSISKLGVIIATEDSILKREEELLRKIDLKIGAMLRKTDLKEQSIEKTADMNMRYREIRHIR